MDERIIEGLNARIDTRAEEIEALEQRIKTLEAQVKTLEKDTVHNLRAHERMLDTIQEQGDLIKELMAAMERARIPRHPG